MLPQPPPPAPSTSDEAKELYEAAERGDSARVKELIAKGVEVDKWKSTVSASARVGWSGVALVWVFGAVCAEGVWCRHRVCGSRWGAEW